MNSPLQQRSDVLDLDFFRANTYSQDYDSEWSNLSLFADGNDYSEETIETNRNIYYQTQLANQVHEQQTKIILLLVSALKVHLNINQNFTINTPEISMLLARMLFESLLNKEFENDEIFIPSQMNSTLNNNDVILFQVSFVFLKG